MRIAYLLDNPALAGGVKVVFHHAALLRQLGHEVTVLARGERPSWTERFKVEYRDLTAGKLNIPAQDLVVATYFTTIPAAETLDVGPIVHFCQGFEGSHSWLRELWSAIEAVYARKHPAFAVTPFLGAMLAERFGKKTFVVPPAVDPLFMSARSAWRPRSPTGPVRILVPGIFECDVKAVPTALQAVLRLRQNGFDCRVVRLSTFPLGEAERALLAPEAYHQAIEPAAVARLMKDIDLLLFPSLPEEGFGLPVLEACASGVPTVATRIPSTEYMKGETAAKGSPRLVPVGGAQEMAAAAAEWLGDAIAMEQDREEGVRVAERFSESAVQEQLEQAVRWAASLSD